ncbi:MAG: S9 family peptidase [Chloroflexota bacterium]
MTQQTEMPYGSWQSPISTDMIASGGTGLTTVAVDGGDIYWLERRPTEQGRSVIVRRDSKGNTEDVTPTPFDVRSRVHEYGGGAFTISDGHIYFVNQKDQRIYHHMVGNMPQAITPEGPLSYADMTIDQQRNRIICVCEDHSNAGQEPTNTLVMIDITNGHIQTLVEGNDFYATPRLSPDAGYLAWLAWNHPNMPWDGTELWVASLTAEGQITNAVCVAGGPEESIFQPTWSPDGTLYFVSDRNGWWNLYRWQNDSVEPLVEMTAECGLPQWIFGLNTYAFESPDSIIAAIKEQNVDRLARIATNNGALTWLETPYTEIRDPQVQDGQLIFIGKSPILSPQVVHMNLATGQEAVLRKARDIALDPQHLSLPQSIEFPTTNNLTAYGLFYPPQNKNYIAPAEEKPPLIVMSHGGPTGATFPTLSMQTQFWTNRGFAVLDVNYGGSTSYGRAYRQRLNGQWGIVDVEDCINGARFLVEQGWVDGERLIITGGSAGGYTTLCALTFHDVFKAGASHFGIGDLEALVRDTHKFESRYCDRLVGPYPEERAMYQARSPINFTEQLSCPIILLQGLDDKVVPPNQAETMYEAVRNKGLPVAYLPFENEGHGFRRAETIKRALEAELYFYAQVFGFTLADSIEPIDIVNL